ncbi:hypothetical protein GCM10027442_22220 [Emticicia fontis]
MNIPSFAQNFTEYYQRAKYNEYKGCLLKVRNDKRAEDFYYSFYDAIPTYRKQGFDRPDLKLLANRVFRVDSVFIHKYKINSNDYEESPFFKLSDIKNKEVLYFRFDVLSSERFVFLVAELKFTEKMVSEDIERFEDKFTGEVFIRSPLNNDAAIIKKIFKGKVQYFLLLKISRERSVTYLNKGVIVLFTDGKKWQRPNEKVGLNYNESFEYSAFILLTPQDIEVFQNKNIEGFRLNIYDQDISSIDSEKLKYYLRVIRNLK